LGKIKAFLGCEINKDEVTGDLKMTNALKNEKLVEEYGLPSQGREVDTPMAYAFVTSPLASSVFAKHRSNLGIS
jgi:hypothetical protein